MTPDMVGADGTGDVYRGNRALCPNYSRRPMVMMGPMVAAARMSY